MSFHFTQICAFIAYSFRFYGLLFVVYWGKNTEIFNRTKKRGDFFWLNKVCLGHLI